MNKWKKLFGNVRFMLLLGALVIAVILIHPDFYNDGVAIRSIGKNTSASVAGMKSPFAQDKPMLREVIYEINGRAVKNLEDYARLTSDLQPGDTVTLRTRSSYTYSGNQRKYSFWKQQNRYILEVLPEYNITVLDETEEITVPLTVPVNVTVNGTVVQVNKTVNTTKTVNKVKKEVIGAEGLGIEVYDAPSTNIKKGLDLQGGTRVLLAPADEAGLQDMETIMDSLKERLNVFGLSDIVVRMQKDLSGNSYIMVEVAGSNEDEVKDLISRQGKFEAKIDNTTVFLGGQDIKSVCRTPDCSFVENPRRPCGLGNDGLYHCSFEFSITLSPEAAQRQADATRDLDVVTQDGEAYLSENIDFYLDDENVDSLRISEDLRGKPATSIAISGGGSGASLQEARADSAANMKRLQTVLITGSLPIRLEIVKIDTVSPTLGREFVKNIWVLGLLAMAAVAAIVMVRYRDLRISAPMLFTMMSEVMLLLGLAALIGWNLDLAAIAGILVAVGTGVDDQIVIIDEIKRGMASHLLNWKERIKRAFFIIMAAYATTVVAMIPLYSAGAGLVRGFALTTIAGVSIGVFITRPAFATIMEIFAKD